jgi:hypothetical protein
MEDLAEALVCEDQGENPRVFAEEMKRGAAVPVLRKIGRFSLRKLQRRFIAVWNRYWSRRTRCPRIRGICLCLLR